MVTRWKLVVLAFVGGFRFGDEGWLVVDRLDAFVERGRQFGHQMSGERIEERPEILIGFIERAIAAGDGRRSFGVVVRLRRCFFRADDGWLSRGNGSIDRAKSSNRRTWVPACRWSLPCWCSGRKLGC